MDEHILQQSTGTQVQIPIIGSYIRLISVALRVVNEQVTNMFKVKGTVRERILDVCRVDLVQVGTVKFF